jgi:hypothetical protein
VSDAEWEATKRAFDASLNGPVLRDLKAENERLRTQINAVLAVHYMDEGEYEYRPSYWRVGKYCGVCGVSWPCTTVKTILGIDRGDDAE